MAVASVLSRRVANVSIEWTPAAWDAARTYAAGDACTAGGVKYVSLQAGNLNQPPASSPLWWQDQATFYAAQVVAFLPAYTGATIALPPAHHLQIERHRLGFPDATTSSAALMTAYESDHAFVWGGTASIDALKNAVDTIARPAPGF